MRTAVVALLAAMPMVLFFAILIAFLDGQIGMATLLLSAFAICAITITAAVFHAAPAMERTEEEG
jgi:hypothetical protein